MTNEERDLIARFVSRVGGSPQSGGFLPGQAGSVPQSQTPLPPIDREADNFIADQFQRFPEARYRITQMAVVQEAALSEMNNRLQRLQWELDQARQQPAQPQPQKAGGLFGGLFGGGSSQPPQPQRGNPWGNAGAQPPGYGGGQPGYGGGQQYAPPPPQYSPGYRPGMFGGGGSGFLGSALTTAAGVAGGLVVGNALMNAFGGHSGSAAAATTSGGFLGGGDTGAFDGGGVIPAADPTFGFGSADSFGSGGDNKGFNDAGVSQDASFDGGGGGGFDSGGFDSGSDNA